MEKEADTRGMIKNNNKMTAEEFLESKEPNTFIVPKKWLIEFAKYHVQEALKEAQQYVDYDKLDWIDFYDFSKGVETVKNTNYEEVLNCYPLENIK